MGSVFSSQKKIMDQLGREVVEKMVKEWDSMARGQHGVRVAQRGDTAMRTLIDFAVFKMSVRAGEKGFPSVTALRDGFDLTDDKQVNLMCVIFEGAWEHMLTEDDGKYTEEQGMIVLVTQNFLQHASRIAKAKKGEGLDFNINHALLQILYGPPDADLSFGTLQQELTEIQAHGTKFMADTIRPNDTAFKDIWRRTRDRAQSARNVLHLEGALASVRTAQDNVQAARNVAEAAARAAPADRALHDAAEVATTALLEAMQVTNLFQTRLDAAVAARDALAAL